MVEQALPGSVTIDPSPGEEQRLSALTYTRGKVATVNDHHVPKETHLHISFYRMRSGSERDRFDVFEILCFAPDLAKEIDINPVLGENLFQEFDVITGGNILEPLIIQLE
jgi:hypothetical protein